MFPSILFLLRIRRKSLATEIFEFLSSDPTTDRFQIGRYRYWQRRRRYLIFRPEGKLKEKLNVNTVGVTS
jgi:hypothetical protein